MVSEEYGNQVARKVCDLERSVRLYRLAGDKNMSTGQAVLKLSWVLGKVETPLVHMRDCYLRN